MTGQRASWLDGLRGLAALAVVLWHWQHFYYVGGALPAGFDRTVQPLYDVLAPAYVFGNRAVDLFFMLSGFVFFWRYGETAATGDVTAARFAWLRFSRLYPLHLATLLLVALLQDSHRRATGGYFVYQANDGIQLAHQLVMASHWRPDPVFSFNGPIWSVSVEILLYAMFFAVARASLIRSWHRASLAVTGLAVYLTTGYEVAQGVWCFFLGGLLHAAVRHLRGREAGVIVGSALTAVVAIAVVTGLTLAGAHPASPPVYLVLTGVLFPSLVLMLAAAERFASSPAASVIGELSYSSYLLHFPLQLGFVLAWPWDFSAPSTLGLFMVLLIGASFASYRLFEHPMQRWLRSHGGEASVKGSS